MSYATQPRITSTTTMPTLTSMPVVRTAAPVMTTSMSAAPRTIVSSVSSPKASYPSTTSVGATAVVSPARKSISAPSTSYRVAPAQYVNAAPAYATAARTYATSTPLTSYKTIQAPIVSSRPGTEMTATTKSKQATPNLDAAVHDENAFVQFVINASRSKQTSEYKELYHFLLDVFLEADTDFDGLVGTDRFDYMIERAAMLPRKYGFAPTEAETYQTAEARRAAREEQFRTIDTSGDGLIAFDEWLEWSYNHIIGKAQELTDGRAVGMNWNQDQEHFIHWVRAATSNKASKEYKEMYHFLQECFTAADSDHDGTVSHAEFDSLIEVAAEAPRRFGLAPSAAQTYASDADRVAARQQEFLEMDIHRQGYISFDDWLRWSYSHICAKAQSLQ